MRSRGQERSGGNESKILDHGEKSPKRRLKKGEKERGTEKCQCLLYLRKTTRKEGRHLGKKKGLQDVLPPMGPSRAKGEERKKGE